MKRNFLVGYDISDEKRLAKIAKVMQGYGSRIQYSFFHCLLSERQIIKMKESLNKIVKETEDQVIILPVTPEQLKSVEFIGYKTNLETEGLIIV